MEYSKINLAHVVVGTILILLIKKTIFAEKIEFHNKKFNKEQILGGLIFGWTMTGVYPWPLFAQIGSGTTVIIVEC